MAGTSGGEKSGGSGKGLKGSLTVLGTAAVLTVYAAGYARTEDAARRLEEEFAGRPLAPTPADPAGTVSQAGMEVPSATGSESLAVNSTTAQDGMSGDALPTSDGAVSPAATATSGSTAASAGAQPATSSETPANTTAPVNTAPAAVATAPVAEAPPPPAPESIYKDGTFSAWGWRTRHGEIEATVEIKAGRIVSATVKNCGMRWPCADVTALMWRVPQLQSYNVGMIGGATQTSDAFTTAVREALKLALNQPAAPPTP